MEQGSIMEEHPGGIRETSGRHEGSIPLPLRAGSSGHFERPAAAKLRKVRKLCGTQGAVSDERKFKYECVYIYIYIPNETLTFLRYLREYMYEEADETRPLGRSGYIYILVRTRAFHARECSSQC